MTDVERAIEYLNPLCEHPTITGEFAKSLKAVIAALQAESDRNGCEICKGGLPCDNGCDGLCDICDIPEVWKTIHKTGHYNYCPICGREIGENE